MNARERMRSRELEDRLEEWGREYGGSRYELHDMASPIASLVKWGGRAPQGLGRIVLNTPADEVQAVYEAMQKDGHRLPALVLMLEYQKPGQPLESKLYQLRRMGENLGRTRYYFHLRVARNRVARSIGLQTEEVEG